MTNQPVNLSGRTPDAGSQLTVKRIAVMAIFIALAAVGAMIKIPSPVGTVALDAAPGFFVAIGFTGWMGAVVAIAGHLLTAALGGFPLSVPVHLFIAVGMGVCAFAFGALAKRAGKFGWLIGFVVAALLNSFALNLIMLPIGGWPAYVAMIVPLLVGAVVNLAIATVAWFALKNTNLLESK